MEEYEERQKDVSGRFLPFMQYIEAQPKDLSGPFLPFAQYIEAVQDCSSDEWKRGCYDRCMDHWWIHRSESECTSHCEL